MVRAIAADGKIRAFAASTRDTVEEARRRHDTSPVVTAALGRLLTAGAMMGSMMEGESDRLTLKIQGDGPVKALTVVADENGNVKGFAQEPQVLLHANDQGKLDVAGAIGIGILTVTRDLGLKEPYVGTTMLTTSEIAEDLTYYFAASEQTPSSVALGVLMNRENTVRQAGGFILQLMPGVDDETITTLENRLGGLSSVSNLLDSGMTPEEILACVLEGFGVEILDRMPVRFCCDCSREKIKNAVAALGREDLLSLIEDGEPVEAHCDFCGQDYLFSPEEIREMTEKKDEEEREETT